MKRFNLEEFKVPPRKAAPNKTPEGKIVGVRASKTAPKDEQARAVETKPARKQAAYKKKSPFGVAPGPLVAPEATLPSDNNPSKRPVSSEPEIERKPNIKPERKAAIKPKLKRKAPKPKQPPSSEPAVEVGAKPKVAPQARRVTPREHETPAQQVATAPQASTPRPPQSSQPQFRNTRKTSGLDASVLAAREPYSPKVEALRQVVSRLLLAGRAQSLQPMAVCSVDNGDGRSFVAANLAVLFAQAGKRTLLIDADFRNADQHRLFNIDAGPGLAELLMGQSDWDVIKPIEDVPELYVLPFGSHPGNPIELLASGVFAEVFEKLANICDVVIVDTPAGEAHVDAQAIAAQVGSALMVIKHRETSVSAAQDLSDDLSRAGARIVGAVVNLA